jgi:60 kDa SS-A/Ro ribonucleoprotein
MSVYVKELIRRTNKYGDQVVTHQGGLAYEADPWTRLHRFLILGSDGGTFYVSERTLTQQNAQVVVDCLDADGLRVVEAIVSVSTKGEAPRQTPAIFAQAIAASHTDPAVRRAALEALPLVCRTGTHLFTFAAFADAMRGWGRGLCRAVGEWYQAKPVDKLIYQAIKYQQRDGWSHRDLLRLAHPKTADPYRNAVYKWMVSGAYEGPEHDDQLRGTARLAEATTFEQAAAIVKDYRLPREIVPTGWLTLPHVWAALLDDMPMTAMIRNLGTMSKVGLLVNQSAAEAHVIAELANRDRIRASRLHPLGILLAQITYAQGHGMRSDASWPVSRRVVDALDAAFYDAFANVAPSGKRILLAVDSSGSMQYASTAGTPLPCNRAAAAMALVTLATEPNADAIAFDTEVYTPALSARQRLDDVTRAFTIGGGGTNLALAWEYANSARDEYDAIVIYTDSEDGRRQTGQARLRYRVRVPDYREVVVGMEANEFTAVNGPLALNVAGFDASAPAVISQFVGGAL